MARIGGSSDTKPLCFTGHLDVVPLGGAPWSVDPFAGEIANNFSPFVTLRGGPIFTIDGEETGDNFMERWSNSQTHWSPGGFIGGGVEFKWVNLSSVILHIGVDILPLSQTADGRKDYSGMLIHIAFNRFRK